MEANTLFNIAYDAALAQNAALNPREAILFAFWCAAYACQNARLDEPALIDALQTARQFADGQCSKEQINDANYRASVAAAEIHRRAVKDKLAEPAKGAADAITRISEWLTRIAYGQPAESVHELVREVRADAVYASVCASPFFYDTNIELEELYEKYFNATNPKFAELELPINAILNNLGAV